MATPLVKVIAVAPPNGTEVPALLTTPGTLPPGLVFGLLCGYALGALAAGAWALIRHDA